MEDQVVKTDEEWRRDSSAELFRAEDKFQNRTGERYCINSAALKKER